MKHIIVIETVDAPRPKHLPDNFEAEVIVAIDAIARKHKGESFVQCRFYEESAIAAVHEMYNATKWEPNAACP